MQEDILNFDVRFYTTNPAFSPVGEYLVSLAEIDKKAFYVCVSDIIDLPKLIFLRHKHIKFFKTAKHSFFELKSRYKNNEFRFFFILEKPSIIVIYGFTKKSQKTEKIDIKNAIGELGNYLKRKTSISVKNILTEYDL